MLKIHRPRVGFTLVEATIALAVFALLAVIVAQAMFWSLRERARLTAHQAALELAANVLEAARAQPFEQLDKGWADAQTIPSDMADLLPGGKVIVKLEPMQSLPQSRRVTVEIRWRSAAELPEQSVQLTSVLTARTAKKTGGEP